MSEFRFNVSPTANYKVKLEMGPQLRFISSLISTHKYLLGAQWLSGRVLDSRPRGRGFEPHRRHCVVSLSKNINPS